MKKNIITILIISSLVFITFRLTLFHQFVEMDDPLHLLQNKNVLSLEWQNIQSIFSSNVSGHYMPLTILMFAVEYHLFQFNPFIYHLNNLLLHIGVVILIFLFGRNLGLSVIGAASAALIFGIHPIHVESVAWVTERKDVLYSFFYMFSLNAYLCYLVRKSRRYYFLSIIFGFLSILSKPMAFSLPLIFLLCDWFKRRNLNKEMIIDKIPHFLYIVPISLVSYFSLHNLFKIENTFLESILLCIRNFLFYLHKFILPINLTPLYNFTIPISILHHEYLLSIIAFLILMILLIRFKSSRWLWFALLFYLFSLAVMLNYDDRAYITTISDRRMYLPSLGICLWIGFLIEQLTGRIAPKIMIRRGLFLLLSGFFMALSFMSINQSMVWKNNQAYWDHVLQVTPENSLAFYARGIIFQKQGDFDQAIADYSKSISINPQSAVAYNNRGIVYDLLGKYNLAVIDYNQAIAINPKHAKAHNNRGYLYFQMGSYLHAINDYNISIKLYPEEPLTYLNRSRCYYQLKKFDKALEDAKTAQLLGVLNLDDYIMEISINSTNPNQDF